jgi:peptidoglycan/LPS O-acetylase OafA/YrhL
MIRAQSVRAVAWAAAGIASALLWDVPVMAETVVWGSQPSQVLLVAPCFFAGALLRELPRLPGIRTGAAAGALAGLGYLAVLAWAPQLQHIAGWTLLPLAVVLVGRASFPVVRSAGRWGNPAYGVFLTGFPIQQTLIDGYGISHAWVSLGLTVLLSFAAGYILLRVVEQPIISRVHQWTRRPSGASPRQAEGHDLARAS